jgi:hypothetical protein
MRWPILPSRKLLSLLLGVIVGWLVTPAILLAQTPPTPAFVKQTGAYGVEVECAAQVALTIAVDGGAATTPALTWTGAGPYRAQVAYPATSGARTLGPHMWAISDPGATITLADGSPYTYPPGTLTLQVNVVPDTPPAANPPKFIRWLILAIATAAKAIWAWLT